MRRSTSMRHAIACQDELDGLISVDINTILSWYLYVVEVIIKGKGD